MKVAHNYKKNPRALPPSRARALTRTPRARSRARAPRARAPRSGVRAATPRRRARIATGHCAHTATRRSRRTSHGDAHTRPKPILVHHTQKNIHEITHTSFRYRVPGPRLPALRANMVGWSI